MNGFGNYTTPPDDLGNLSHMMRDLKMIVMQPRAGIMKMFPGGPDTGLGVGSKPRHQRFLKYSNDDEWMRWASLAEQYVMYYRLTPGSRVRIDDIGNWMEMNGFTLQEVCGLVRGLESHGMVVVSD